MARVLLIDDHLSVLESLGYFLQYSGHSVEFATTGAAGLRGAVAGGFDLVLLDIEMPDISGLAVCRAIKSNPAMRALPIVMMTARHLSEVVKSAAAAGAALVLSKPFDLDALNATILRLVAVPARADATPVLAGH